jgi:hypothetical protein
VRSTSPLAWIGVVLGSVSLTGIVLCLAIARSVPQRAPTTGDDLTRF